MLYNTSVTQDFMKVSDSIDILVVSEQSNPLSGGICLKELNKSTNIVINEPF